MIAKMPKLDFHGLSVGQLDVWQVSSHKGFSKKTSLDSLCNKLVSIKYFSHFSSRQLRIPYTSSSGKWG